MSLNAIPLLEGGQQVGAVVSFTDVTASYLPQRQLEAQALHGPPTGLPNRRQGTTLLEQLCAPRPAQPAAVMILILHHFPNLLDRIGRQGADHLLQLVAQRLEDAVSDRGVAAHLLDGLLRHADLARRHACAGDGSGRRFEPVMAADVERRLRLEECPQRAVTTGTLSGLINDLGTSVLREALCRAVRWNAGRRAPLGVNLNVSVTQFSSGTFLRPESAGGPHRPGRFRHRVLQPRAAAPAAH